MRAYPALLISLLTQPALAAEQVIEVGTFSVAPYLIDQGDAPPRGAIIDFYDQEIAPRMGVKFRWNACVTPPRLVRGLQDGSYQFTPILTRTADREAAVSFSNQTYLGFNHSLALKPEHPLGKYSTLKLEQLKGLTIGWIQGGPLPEELQQQSGIIWDLSGVLKWERANLGKLAMGRIDAAYFSNPATPLYHALETGQSLVVRPLPLPERPLYAAFSRNAPAELIKRYEQAAKEAFANGRFERYLQPYLERRGD